MAPAALLADLAFLAFWEERSSCWRIPTWSSRATGYCT